MAEQSYSYKFGYFATASVDISGANSVVLPIVGGPFRVMEIGFNCQTATASAAPTITVTKRVSPGIDTSAVTVGTFSIATGYAIGDEVRIATVSVPAASPYVLDLNRGETLKFASSGAGTGTVWFWMTGYHYPSGPNPQSSFSSTAKSGSTGAGNIKYAAFTFS